MRCHDNKNKCKYRYLRSLNMCNKKDSILKRLCVFVWTWGGVCCCNFQGVHTYCCNFTKTPNSYSGVFQSGIWKQRKLVYILLWDISLHVFKGHLFTPRKKIDKNLHLPSCHIYLFVFCSLGCCLKCDMLMRCFCKIYILW